MAKKAAEERKREEEDKIPEEELSKSQRYRRNVRKFVEAAQARAGGKPGEPHGGGMQNML